LKLSPEGEDDEGWLDGIDEMGFLNIEY